MAKTRTMTFEAKDSAFLRQCTMRAAFRIALLVGSATPALAQNPLLSAQQFGVLGASTVTNTGPTTIKGDLGVYPGTSITRVGEHHRYRIRP